MYISALLRSSSVPCIWRVTLLTALCLAAPLASSEPREDVHDRYQRLHLRWVAQVEQLASQYESQGDSDAAESIRNSLIVPTGAGISIPLVSPSGSASSSSNAAAAPDRTEWQAGLARIRKQHARELFDLATAAYREGDISFCYDLVRQTIEHDPDHGPARSLLGFTKYHNDWVTPFAAGKLRAGFIWDERFGWVPKAHLPHYDKGEQLWKGQWLPNQEVAKYRENWANAWEVETEHYVIRTNVSLERGVEFAAKLEKLYAVFFRLYAGFFSPREQMGVLFGPTNRRNAIGKIPDAEPRAARKFRVHFYRTKDEYLEALRPYVKSGLDVTTGMYLTGTRVAYFYVNTANDDSTVIHEATHQLFSESREHRHGDGSRGNFWVLEGIACYMESFHDEGDHVELGSWETPRLKRGRARLPNFLPVAKLIQLDRKDFDGPDLVTLYAESACLAHFLMHSENGRYRDALVHYLEEVYLGKADYETLSGLLGTDYETLDRQFRAYVAEGKQP